MSTCTLKRVLITLLLYSIILSADGKLGIQEHPGEYIPLNVEFKDEYNNTVTFKQLLDNKPAILTLNYFGCPHICTPQLQDLAKNLEMVNLKENKDYKVITLSFNPNETSEDAAHKKKELLSAMRRNFNADAWSFLTGKEVNIKKITQSVGFSYEKEENSPNGMVQYTHPAVLVAISPEGKITRYLNGIKQLPFDIQMAMLEASKGTVRPTIAKTLLFCFAFDPKNKTYVFAAEKVGAVLMSLILGGFFIYLLKSGRKQNTAKEESSDES
ncbi:MAG: SCO family protein [Thiovulaceae bacterium]|nr:SCO family protein [Sulfurimonadaceae bacterium]